MKACRVHRFGPPDVIAFEETTTPAPNKDEVLVRIEAAGVGPWDTWVRSGKSVINHDLPLTLGSDFSGIVTAIANGATPFQVGQQVYGVTNALFTGA
jgi:NADPH:quinone reductase-like Zn-dependent oxidoreductase